MKIINIKKIDYISGKINEFILEMKKLGEIIDKVKELKDNLFFNLIYENMNLRRSEGERFDNAIVILDNIGKELKYKGIIEIYSFLNFFKKIMLFGIKKFDK